MTDTPPLPSQPNLYVLDANVFIAAWRDNFRPQLFPDLWERILDLCREGTLVSIDRVLAEITSPPDLVAWLQSNEDDIFASSIEPSALKYQRCKHGHKVLISTLAPPEMNLPE